METAASSTDIQGESEDSSERGSLEASGNSLKRKAPPSNTDRTPTRPCTQKGQYQPKQCKLMALRVTGWPASWNEVQVHAYIREGTDPLLRGSSFYETHKTPVVLKVWFAREFNQLSR